MKREEFDRTLLAACLLGIVAFAIGVVLYLIFGPSPSS